MVRGEEGERWGRGEEGRKREDRVGRVQGHYSGQVKERKKEY